MRPFLLISVMSALAATMHAQARILTADDLSRALAEISSTPPTNREVLADDHFVVKVARLDHRTGPGELHVNEDRLFYILKGAGAVCVGGTLTNPRQIGPGESQASELPGCKLLAMLPGTVISVPRGIPYRMQAADTAVEFLVIRVK